MSKQQQTNANGFQQTQEQRQTSSEQEHMTERTLEDGKNDVQVDTYNERTQCKSDQVQANDATCWWAISSEASKQEGDSNKLMHSKVAEARKVIKSKGEMKSLAQMWPQEFSVFLTMYKHIIYNEQTVNQCSGPYQTKTWLMERKTKRSLKEAGDKLWSKLDAI